MDFPKFWAKGKAGAFICWGWSSRSIEEAQAFANEAASRLADRFRGGNYPPKHGCYYPNRPFREEVLQEIRHGSGELSAVVTRNSYGCRVLNTSRVMFVDIDFTEKKSSGGFFQKLFGKAQPPDDDSQNIAIDKIERWSTQRPEWGWRIYRTRAGLRLLATHDLIEAGSSSSDEVFGTLDSDPLYRKLCDAQKCFRARLTPKPWRCGVHNQPDRWPWLDSQQEKRFLKWEANYQSCAINWATCSFIKQLGNSVVHPDVQPILTLHDEATRAGSNLRLA